jgi:hypothetical protein
MTQIVESLVRQPVSLERPLEACVTTSGSRRVHVGLVETRPVSVHNPSARSRSWLDPPQVRLQVDGLGPDQDLEGRGLRVQELARPARSSSGVASSARRVV